MANQVRILIAEDDKDDQELIEESIRLVNPEADLHITDHGKDVLTFLEKCQPKDFPCLIVLDFNMPDMNGADVLRFLRSDERYHHIPAVVLSTSNAGLYQEISLRSGARQYYQKPDSFQAMVEISRSMLEYCG